MTPIPRVYDAASDSWRQLGDGENLASLTLEEIRLLVDLDDEIRPDSVRSFDLPWDPAWLPTEMSMRHGAVIAGRKRSPSQKNVGGAVARLDAWARHWGLARHGDVFYATSSSGPMVSSYFKIVDLLAYTEQVRKDEREKAQQKGSR